MTDDVNYDEAKIHRDNTDKRIEDLKWFIGILSGAVAVLVAGLSAFVGFNVASERASLIEFKDTLREDVRESLGKVAQPTLTLESVNGQDLEGATIEAWVAPNEKKQHQIHFMYTIDNRGNGRSGPMFAKLYSSDIPLSDPDVDQTGYKYSTFIDWDNFSPREVPGQAKMLYTINIGVPTDFNGLQGETSLMLRLYFGNGKMTQAKVKLHSKK